MTPLTTRGFRTWAIPGIFLVGALAVAGSIIATRGGDSPNQPRTIGVVDANGLRQPIHEHADGALFIRGKQVDFSDPKFVTTEDHELSPNVHIHKPRYTVVHVHREGTTWDEFLRSLGFELTDPTLLAKPEQTTLKLPSGEILRVTPTETFKFYVNGTKVDGVAGLNIAALSQVLISYGPESESEVLAQFDRVTDEACIPQGICIARGNGNGEHGEPEPCSGGTTCTG